MKHHFEHLLQLLAGVAIGAAGLGMFFGVTLPWRFAELTGAVLAIVFLMSVWAAVVIGLLLLGMWLQRREHRGHIRGLLKQALGSYF